MGVVAVAFILGCNDVVPVCVIHLSDIHFRDNKNWISGKAAEIARAARAEERSCNHYLVIISGDIAFSGAEHEYAQAAEFLKNLKEHFADGAVLQIATIPGNHDCNFRTISTTRELIIGQLDTLEQTNAPDVIDLCTVAQNEYFSFEAQVRSSSQPKIGAARLFEKVRLRTDIAARGAIRQFDLA